MSQVKSHMAGRSTTKVNLSLNIDEQIHIGTDTGQRFVGVKTYRHVLWANMWGSQIKRALSHMQLCVLCFAPKKLISQVYCSRTPKQCTFDLHEGSFNLGHLGPIFKRFCFGFSGCRHQYNLSHHKNESIILCWPRVYTSAYSSKLSVNKPDSLRRPSGVMGSFFHHSYKHTVSCTLHVNHRALHSQKPLSVPVSE